MDCKCQKCGKKFRAEPVEKPACHRVLCGDSRNAEDVGRVTGGAVPFLMVTDPPYGVKLDPAWRDKAGLNTMGKAGDGGGHYMESGAADTEMSWTEVWRLFPGDVAYLWCGDKQVFSLRAALLESGFELRQLLVWVKTLTMTRTQYWCSHEFCVYAVRANRSAGWIGQGGQSSVLDVPSPKHIMSGSKEAVEPHPAQKPLECMARAIRNHEGSGVYDPFLGSGTTMVAAEGLARLCYGIELSPAYVAVILERLSTLGLTPTLEDPEHA